jgi:hypothetical protein
MVSTSAMPTMASTFAASRRRACSKNGRACDRLAGCSVIQMRHALEIPVHRIRIRRRRRAPCLHRDQLGSQLIGKTGTDLVLHVEKVGDPFVKTFAPQMVAGRGIDELDVDAHPASSPLHRALEHVANAEFAADPLQFDMLSLVKAVLRPITKMPAIRDRSVVRLSVTPSTK